MDMQVMDQAIRNAFPLVPAPKAGVLEPSQAGTRFIAGNDGMYREINLPWARVVHKIGSTDVNMPYGAVTAGVELFCSAVPRSLWKEFRSNAVAALPNEMAAALVWDTVTDDWRFVVREAEVATPDKVSFNGQGFELGPDEHIVVDIHSHGRDTAFFSKDDDADDLGTMRFSGVLGNVDADTPSFVLRLNMPHARWNAIVNAQGEFEVML